MLHILCLHRIHRDQEEALRQAFKTRPGIERVFLDHTEHGYFLLCSGDLNDLAAWVFQLEGVYTVALHQVAEL